MSTVRGGREAESKTKRVKKMERQKVKIVGRWVVIGCHTFYVGTVHVMDAIHAAHLFSVVMGGAIGVTGVVVLWMELSGRE